VNGCSDPVLASRFAVSFTANILMTWHPYQLNSVLSGQLWARYNFDVLPT
jgi:hypothetical protein